MLLPPPVQVPQFKAQPLPDFDTVVLPEKKKLEPTKPEPFKLLIDERGAVKSSRWEQMVPQDPTRFTFLFPLSLMSLCPEGEGGAEAPGGGSSIQGPAQHSHS